MLRSILASASLLRVNESRVVLSSMAVLLENVTNCVWHAFSALQQDKSGVVQKSKLKVLTANIGTLLDLYGVEKGLEHYRSTTSLNFDHFKYYLLHEVFSSFPDKLTLTELREYETRIAEVCWLVCRTKYLPRENRIFSDDSVFQLFRIFCLLAELTPDEPEETYQILLHSSEAEMIAQTLATSLGCPWDVDDFTNLCTAIGSFRLSAFVAVLESRCLGEVTDGVAISEAVADMHQTLVDDVIKKGILLKKGYLLPTMREFWVILRPSGLLYYKSRSEKNTCGSVPIEPGSKVEAGPGYKIILQTPERNFELAATNHMTRLQWISALQLAVEYSGGSQSYHRLQALRRRQQRAGRALEIHRARAQLQRERTARQAAEGQARELEAVAKEEAKRLAELEHIRGRLERLLEEETQAKRDEEIVRALQARVLAEEWEKREELERLQEEQRVLLEEERSKRVEFEQLQRDKELQLRNAEKRLEQLEEERKSLDGQLRSADFKIKLSEESKEILEVKLRNMIPSLREGDRVRRAHSFMPSTKERPVMLEVRSSTLRRPTKQ